jgi:hypothetical protein
MDRLRTELMTATNADQCTGFRRIGLRREFRLATPDDSSSSLGNDASSASVRCQPDGVFPVVAEPSGSRQTLAMNNAGNANRGHAIHGLPAFAPTPLALGLNVEISPQ